MYEAQNNPELVYITSQEQLDIKFPVYFEYYQDIVVVADLFKVSVYKVTKQPRYVEQAPQFVKQQASLLLQKPISCLKLINEQRLVISFSDGTVQVYKFSLTEIAEDFRIIPNQDTKGQKFSWYETNEDTQNYKIENICGSGEFIAFSYERTLHVYMNKQPFLTHKFNSKILFVDSFIYKKDLLVIISTGEQTGIYSTTSQQYQEIKQKIIIKSLS